MNVIEFKVQYHVATKKISLIGRTKEHQVIVVDFENIQDARNLHKQLGEAIKKVED